MKLRDDIVARHLVIRGVVQGVGFRWWFLEQARDLDLGGWVRNRRDGRVEALVCGPHSAVAELIHNASVGPVGARVDEVLVEESAERAHVFERQATI